MKEGMMLRYEQAVEKEREEQRMRTEYLEACKPLFHIAMEYGCRFSHNHNDDYLERDKNKRTSSITFAQGSGTIDCLALDLRMKEDDAILRDIGPILEELREHPKLKWSEDNHSSDYLDMGWKGWRFFLKTSDDKQSKYQLLVRAWFENANSCELVGTGEFEETKKLVCD